MNKNLIKIAALLLIIFSFGCEKEFDVNAEWKEITIVYGILDVADSVHYIKVNKAFLNEATSALDLAKISDSNYYKNINVWLETGGNRTKLIRTHIADKEEGIFGTDSNIVYATPKTFKLNAKKTYNIIIENPVTGHRLSSQS